MSEHDLLVLGGGTGNIVASAAADEGLDVGLVERDRLGGTCLNRGCNPSKQLIRRADVVETVRTADSIGVDATVEGVAFERIVAEVTAEVTEAAERKARDARESDRITFYQTEGRFVGERTVDVDAADSGVDVDDAWGGESERLTADRVVLAGGSRPAVPDSVDGTAETDFLTSADALRLTDLPDRLVVVGGGYVAVEMAHFFSAMGSDVTVVGHGDVLLSREDEEVARHLTEVYGERHDLRLGYEVTAVRETDDGRAVTAESEDGECIEVTGDRLLMATGREPNADAWNVSAAGVETDADGFVRTDEYLRTTADGVWAVGDVAGNYMFKHSGDKEAKYAVENAVRGNEREVEYPGMAHAVFGSPQVASLGETEEALDDADVDYEVGRFDYDDAVLGSVLSDEGGFAKALVGDDGEGGEILGFHVVGPEASTLVHEVSTAVAAGASAKRVAETIHVHPALSEVVQGAFRDVYDVAPSGI